MLKIPSKVSVTLSLVLAFAVGLVGIVWATVLPKTVRILLEARESVETLVPDICKSELLLTVLAYLALSAVLFADGLMIPLLFRVRDGRVFTSETVALIRGISWCCILLGAVLCLIGLYFTLAFLIAGLAIFLGLCLRVVKNVIEEAVEIKSENDLTV